MRAHLNCASAYVWDVDHQLVLGTFRNLSAGFGKVLEGYSVRIFQVFIFCFLKVIAVFSVFSQFYKYVKISQIHDHFLNSWTIFKFVSNFHIHDYILNLWLLFLSLSRKKVWIHEHLWIHKQFWTHYIFWICKDFQIREHFTKNAMYIFKREFSLY